jgi:hypothetical protein
MAPPRLMKSRQQVSGQELKKRKKLSSEALLSSTISPQLVSSLQTSWAEYSKTATRSCKSTAQIQTRCSRCSSHLTR